MAKYFEGDIQMDDIESTPFISLEQQEYLDQQETSFQRPQQQEILQSRIQQLSDYLNADIPLSKYFRMQGKKLQFLKEGIWKELTDYDGTFKDHSKILAGISDHDVSQIHETPKRYTGSEVRTEILKQEVEKFYKHIGYEAENLDLNLKRFEVEDEEGFTKLSFKRKNGKWYALTRNDGALRTPAVEKTSQDFVARAGIDCHRNDDLDVSPYSTTC